MDIDSGSTEPAPQRIDTRPAGCDTVRAHWNALKRVTENNRTVVEKAFHAGTLDKPTPGIALRQRLLKFNTSVMNVFREEFSIYMHYIEPPQVEKKLQ